MMYITTKDFAKKIGVSVRRVQVMCKKGQVKNCKKVGKIYLIPQKTPDPRDMRWVKPEIKKRVLEIVSNVLPDNIIKPEFRLIEDLEADYHDIIEILIHLDQTFGIIIEDDDAETVKTVQDIINLGYKYTTK